MLAFHSSIQSFFLLPVVWHSYLGAYYYRANEQRISEKAKVEHLSVFTCKDEHWSSGVLFLPSV